MMQRFWIWLHRIIWKRIRKDRPRWGVPTIRDDDNRCEFYDPRGGLTERLFECHGDGHALCGECVNRSGDYDDSPGRPWIDVHEVTFEENDCCPFCGSRLDSRVLASDCDESETYCPECGYHGDIA